MWPTWKHRIKRSLPASLHVLISASYFRLFHARNTFPIIPLNLKKKHSSALYMYVYAVIIRMKCCWEIKSASCSLFIRGVWLLVRASLLALVCLVSRSQPIASRRRSVPSWFRPLIIQPGASRAPSLPARTRERERQHRPCTQLGRKGNFNVAISAF